eukprot:m.216346 g.216346  ORF g.216346 m.216346 type:complete len:67 (-) comp28301_c0_seq1:957-1157(-)
MVLWEVLVVVRGAASMVDLVGSMPRMLVCHTPNMTCISSKDTSIRRHHRQSGGEIVMEHIHGNDTL